MDVLAFVVVCGAIAAALLINGYRCGRRGDAPLMLERAALAVAAIFVGCMLFADRIFFFWVGLLGLTLALLTASGVARRLDEAAQERLIAGAGGPSRVRRVPAWLVALAAGILPAIPGAAALAVLTQWSDSLSRVGQAAEPVADYQLTAAFAQEMQHIVSWTVAVTAAVAFLPLIAAATAGWVQHRRRRTSTAAFERAVTTWAEDRAIAGTPDEYEAFLLELENVRLAYRLGVAERRTVDRLDQVLA